MEVDSQSSTLPVNNFIHVKGYQRDSDDSGVYNMDGSCSSHDQSMLGSGSWIAEAQDVLPVHLGSTEYHGDINVLGDDSSLYSLTGILHAISDLLNLCSHKSIFT